MVMRRSLVGVSAFLCSCHLLIGADEGTLTDGGAGTGGSSECSEPCTDDNPCTSDNCVDGACEHVPATTFTLTQVPGDCRAIACVGSQLTALEDSTDIPPDDGKECTVELCDGEQPAYTNAPDGTECASVGACFSGTCVGCNSDLDCGTDTPCATYSCVKTVAETYCETNFLPPGTVVSNSPLEDCSALHCNGQNPEPVLLPFDDPEDDDNPCTADGCDDGAIVHTPLTGTVCSDDLFCNGPDTCQSGACVSHAGNPCPGHDVATPPAVPSCDDSCDEVSDDCTGPDAGLTPCNENGDAIVGECDGTSGASNCVGD